MVKGFSRAGYQPPAAFMQVMSSLAQVKLSQFSPLEYSQLLWAYSTAGYRDVALFEAVVGHAIQQLHSKTHLVTKTTVDTMLAACQGVGFWPQLLVDTAEMRGLYVKTKQNLQEDGGAMENLALPAQQQQQVSAAAQAAAAAAAEAIAAAGEGRVAAAGDGDAVIRTPWNAQRSSIDGDSGSSSVMLSAVADAFALVDGAVVQPGPQPEVFFSREQLQQQVYPRQASRLDSYGLQRPMRPQLQQQPPQQQQPHQQQRQQEQADEQQQQQVEQQGLDHPLLRCRNSSCAAIARCLLLLLVVSPTATAPAQRSTLPTTAAKTSAAVAVVACRHSSSSRMGTLWCTLWSRRVRSTAAANSGSITGSSGAWLFWPKGHHQ
jgi:hypothetical protein